jgi:glycosyltransferase involved in cell wall biosynthesis
LPLALLEAMACELPIVAADLPGLEEALGDPPAGVLVRRGDPAAFAQALSGLASDRVRREQLAARARERSRHFSLSSMVDRYCALYVEMLA